MISRFAAWLTKWGLTQQDSEELSVLIKAPEHTLPKKQSHKIDLFGNICKIHSLSHLVCMHCLISHWLAWVLHLDNLQASHGLPGKRKQFTAKSSQVRICLC